MKSLTQLFLLLITLLIYGCSKDDNSTNPTTETTSNIFVLKVGNTWSYSNGDKISIISTDVADNGKTSYLFEGDDDYTFGKRALFYDGNKLYGYELLNRTIGLILDESALPNNSESITVPAGTFNAIKYQEGTTTFWLVKGVGIVRRDRGSESRVLASYTLK